VYPKDEGKSYGGYATHNRTNAHFVFNIPEGLDSADAAPMMCGGVTVYSPLKNYGCGPGKTVGIVGVGGLGHFGVLFAKALGADKVVGISRKADKKDDVLKLGADQYISTDADKDWAKHNAQTLDLIICTVSSEKMPLNDYLSLLKTKGTFIQVGYVLPILFLESTLITTQCSRWRKPPRHQRLHAHCGRHQGRWLSHRLTRRDQRDAAARCGPEGQALDSEAQHEGG
jgi:D-arabinose 1-dehydrogenase-like Zn-dependent alcohol dehydrogenase